MHLFYHPEYLRIQNHQGLYRFEGEDVEIYFRIEGDTAVSLPSGLFGSFQFAQQLGFWTFKKFFREVKEDLRQLAVEQMVIRQPIDIYDQVVGADALMTEGMRVEYLDINHHLVLSSYEHQSLHQMEQRKLVKSSFWVHQTTDWERVYDFILTSRGKAGLKPNISLDKLKKLVITFPDRYQCFVAQAGEKWAAVIVFVSISPGVVYYYLPATAEEYKSASPMVQLLFEASQHYKEKGIKYLDLGISSVKGERQEGLIDFKEHMGGVAMQKPTLALRFN